ncbi:MAG: insulinase family protein [Alphaproteobacteria bacterium]|nr:insulinase family protein [Alphaproteobacteria bacterium]
MPKHFYKPLCHLVLLAGILLIHVPAMAAPEKIFNAEHYTLENGLEIVVIPSARVPAITHMVWYKTGAADEPRGKSGIAHFLEHLMFKGSEGFGPGDFSEKIRALGGNDNAFTSQDYTAYFESIASEHLETVMTMEAGRMRGLNPLMEEVLSERDVILEERRQRTDNDPGAKLSEQLDAATFVNHPYGTPVIGWAHEMASLSWADAKNFYDHWYGPNNAILIVSGDVTGAQVYELAKKIYGPLPRVDVPKRHWISSPPANGEVHVTLYDESVRQPTVETQFRTPSHNQNKDEALALEVLAEIMGGGPSSRLYKSLVIEQKLAASAGMSYSPERVSDATLTLYAIPLPGIEPAAVEEAYKNVLRTLIADGIDAQELIDAKTRMQDAAIYARDSLAGPAMIFGYALVTGSSIDDVEYWPDYISKIQAEDVLAVAKKYLDPDANNDRPVVTGYLLPAPAEDKQQEDAQ